MAGDWLKVEKDTPEKPEVYRLADLLGISQADAFLACFRVWCWADGQAKSGIIVAPAVAIDDIAKVPNFHQALNKVGWLNLRSGAVELPNFLRHMGLVAKRRCLDSVRKMSAREADKMRTNVRKMSAKCPGEEKREKEKSPPTPPSKERERKETTPPPPQGGAVVPESLKTPEFLTAWEEWKTHRREIRHTLKATTEAKQLKKLAKLGPAVAVATIEYSITQGYQGLVTPTGRDGKPPPPQGETPEQLRKRLAAKQAADRAAEEAEKEQRRAELEAAEEANGEASEDIPF